MLKAYGLFRLTVLFAYITDWVKHVQRTEARKKVIKQKYTNERKEFPNIELTVSCQPHMTALYIYGC